MASLTNSSLHWTSTSPIDHNIPTVIFLHAAWMSSSMFDTTIAQLSSVLPGTNLLRVDLNGHGETRNGRKEFTFWDQADDVVELMDELKLDKAIFVGVSMGASVVLHTALSHPSRVAALVVIAATGKSATTEQKESFEQLAQVWASTPVPSEEVMDAAIRSWGGEPDLSGPYARRIKDHWATRHAGAENINAILQSNQEREDILGRLEAIQGPVLMIHGEKDGTYPLDGAEAIRDGLRNATVKFEVIKDSPHLVIGMRDSEDVSILIENFVKEVTTKG